MHPQDLSYTYAGKTDEELLFLVAKPDQLTLEALNALKGELAKRRIDLPCEPKAEVESKSRSERYSGTIALKERRPLRVGEFVAEVLRLYHANFWLFIKLTAPAVVVGYAAVMLARYEARHIFQSLPPAELLSHHSEIIEMYFITLCGYFISWLVFSFSFAAICSAVDHIESKIPLSLTDSLTVLRERLGPVCRLSALLFLFELVLVAASYLLEDGAFSILRKAHVRWGGLTMWTISLAASCIGLLLLSRFALAMPAVVLDDSKVISSLFRSDELTKGKWLVLAALLAKTLVGSYVAAMLPFWIAGWIWDYVRLPNAVLTTASVAAVTVVEPTMFIGFALLYLQMTAKPSGLTLAPLELAAQHFKEI